MHLLIGQIVYTKLDNIGFRSLASSQVPQKIQQAFIQQVAAKYWDIYNPPPSGYQAIFLHQLTPEHTFFGWLYSEDSSDDLDRSSIPYFHCYYLAEPLRDFHLENIFTCLQKGPVSLINRHYPPATLEPIVIQTPWTFNNKFWSYQSSCPGLEIPLDVRDRSYVALHQGELLDIFIPIATETVSHLKSPNSLEHLVQILEMNTVVLDQDPAEIAPVAITPYRDHKENLQRYKQALIEALTQNHFKGDRTGNLKRLQHSLRLTNQDISPIEARIQRQIQAVQRPENYPQAISRENFISAQVIKETVAGETNHHARLKTFPHIVSTLQNFNTTLKQSAQHKFVLAYKNSQLLLGLGIAASSLALLGSIYGLLRTSLVEQSKPELVPSVNSSVTPTNQAQSKFKLSYPAPITSTDFSPNLKMSLADEVSFARYSRPRD
ncbi:MAG: hypothetical protein KME05_01440 [Gloeocapsa sp. UFS-A4-WI-NPMV-4B04]|jgi:hypothetical protein|nr:hypothetical protein [Gloeocapsa sp. UFS-A4-WI-NPMV-4B04]